MEEKTIPIATRRALILRANFKCEYVDSDCNGALGAHHIDENPDNNELSNLLLLCNAHHKKEHAKLNLRNLSRKEKKRIWDRQRYLRIHPNSKAYGKNRLSSLLSTWPKKHEQVRRCQH